MVLNPYTVWVRESFDRSVGSCRGPCFSDRVSYPYSPGCQLCFPKMTQSITQGLQGGELIVVIKFTGISFLSKNVWKIGIVKSKTEMSLVPSRR